MFIFVRSLKVAALFVFFSMGVFLLVERLMKLVLVNLSQPTCTAQPQCKVKVLRQSEETICFILPPLSASHRKGYELVLSGA